MSILKSALMLLAFLSFSSFHSSPMAFAGEEAKGEKEGEGKEKKELPEWSVLMTSISTLKARVDQKREIIAKLIEEKQKTPPNSPRIKEIFDEMVSNYKEMVTMEEEYNSKNSRLNFRFPERAAKEDRKYEPIAIKPLEQIEQELGTEQRLTRNAKKIRSQYQLKESSNEEGKPSESGATVTKKSGAAEGKKPKAINESDPVNLSR